MPVYGSYTGLVSNVYPSNWVHSWGLINNHTMTALQYVPKHIATAGTTVVAAAGNVTVHTVNFPKATVGTTIFASAANVVYGTFPIGSVGSLILDAVYPNGLSVGTTSALDFITVTTDTP